MSAILLILFLFLLVAGIAIPIVQGIRNNGYNAKQQPLYFFPAVGLVLLSFVFLALFAGYSPVEQGTVGVVKRMGAVTGILQPGPHFVTPFVTTVDDVSTKTLTVNPSEDASSLDLQQVHTQVTLAYHFEPTQEGIIYIYSKLIDNSPNAVENKVVNPAIFEAIKATTAKYNVQELVEKRSQVRDDIEKMVAARIAPYHIVAETVSITDFHFSKEYETSIEQKQVAQQDAEKAKNVLEQVKTEAAQKIAAAEGEAAALKAQKSEITPELLQLRTIEMLDKKWDGRLPESYYGGSAPLPIVQAAAGAQSLKK